jgi:hypothetical protein
VDIVEEGLDTPEDLPVARPDEGRSDHICPYVDCSVCIVYFIYL